MLSSSCCAVVQQAHLFVCSFIHPPIHALIHTFIRLVIHSVIHVIVYSVIHACIKLFEKFWAQLGPRNMRSFYQLVSCSRSPGNQSVAYPLQGAVYHWTISTGFSLAEATNLYLGSLPSMLPHLQHWYTLTHAACTQVGSCSFSALPLRSPPACQLPCAHPPDCSWRP